LEFVSRLDKFGVSFAILQLVKLFVKRKKHIFDDKTYGNEATTIPYVFHDLKGLSIQISDQNFF
jgi:hypothetical protein